MDLQNLLKKHNTKIMGVINITPNSFSDGSINLDSNNLYINFKSLKEDCDILDIGAESTAPFNDAISAIDELNRFEENLFPLIQSTKDPHKTISIDTYKPEVFYEVAMVINKFWPKCSLIFNDISGQVDSELRYLLKDSLKFDYVLCHNLAPSRLNASDHMDYQVGDVISSVSNFFYEHKDLLNKKRSIYADPCFGFSKTYAQNHELLNHLHQIESIKLYDSIVVGVSRKSFLRMPKTLSYSQNSSEIEQIHSCVLASLIRKLDGQIIVRTHDVTPVKSALKVMEMIP